MSTTTGSTIVELSQEADTLEREFQEKHGAIMARIRDMADAAAGNYQVGQSNGTVAPSPSPSPSPAPKKRGRPRKDKSATTASVPKSKKTTAKTTAKKTTTGGKVKPNERNYSNKISLREAIWQVLDQGPEQWAKSVSDFPDDAEGLTVAEVRHIIEETNMWQSSSSNISPQVQQHLYKLKDEGKIARGGDRRYYIVEGAEL